MRAAIALLLLLLATPAHAATIILIGDSLAAGSAYTTGGGNVSRMRPAASLAALVKKLPVGNTYRNATVEDWTVGGTEPTEWYFKPGKGSECVGVNNPWDCCTGAGTGSCICDDTSNGSLYSYYGHLKSACINRTPILNHITQNADLALIHTDGIVVNSTADAVDDLQALVTAVDAMAGTVLISSPTYLTCPALGTCSLCDNHSAVRTEMNVRAMITGPDFFTGPPSRCGADLIHVRDSSYAGMAQAWLGKLP